MNYGGIIPIVIGALLVAGAIAGFVSLAKRGSPSHMVVTNTIDGQTRTAVRRAPEWLAPVMLIGLTIGGIVAIVSGIVALVGG